MGKIRSGFLLMLLAALAVLVAGERLARREVEDRKEVDRIQLEGFTLALGGELERIEELLEERLWKLGERAMEKEDLMEVVDGRAELRSVYLLGKDGVIREWVPLLRVGEVSAPEVLVGDQAVPLRGETAVIFGVEFFEKLTMGESGWRESGDGRHRAFWMSADGEGLVVILCDFAVISEQLTVSLQGWGRERFSPFLSDGKMAVVEGRERVVVLGEGGEGVASVAMPLQNDLGTIWVRAWDGVEERTEYHLPSLIGAAVLAVALVGLGWVVAQAQRRAWLEAEERVSFTNRVSHELGTPLTNMELNLELASRSLRSDPERAGERLEKVREEVSRLGRLVGNVLTRSRKEQGVLEESVHRCVPDEVIGKVVEQFCPALERRGIEVEWEGEAGGEMVLDSDALSQVVWNLVSNVEKHARDGKWVGVRSGVRDGVLWVEVEDRGEGIEGGDRERVFEAFERVKGGVKEGVSGTGLGLAICRDLARMMGGELKLLPSDEGSLFRLEVPNRTI
ncbi:MAG: sensor histidine kinase [Verrucomicrobiaceae bacterium]